MNELFPIIRRKRRPLVPIESLPDRPRESAPAGETAHDDARATKTDNAEHPTTNIEHPKEQRESLLTSVAPEIKSNHAKVTPRRNPR